MPGVNGIGGVIAVQPKAVKLHALQWLGNNVEELSNFVPTSFRMFVNEPDGETLLFVTTPEGPRIVNISNYIVFGEDAFSNTGFYVMAGSLFQETFVRVPCVK